MENDLPLVLEFQRGSAEAFGSLYDRYVRRIYDFIFFRTHHKETAEDLTSTTFMKALEKLGSFDTSKGSLQAWLYRIARNTLIDHYRTSKHDTELDEARGVHTDTDMNAAVDHAAILTRVGVYLDSLPDEQREIVVLRVYSGLSYAEIAEILGKSEASCKMSFSRTINKLREQNISSLLLLLILSAHRYV